MSACMPGSSDPVTSPSPAARARRPRWRSGSRRACSSAAGARALPGELAVEHGRVLQRDRRPHLGEHVAGRQPFVVDPEPGPDVAVDQLLDRRRTEAARHLARGRERDTTLPRRRWRRGRRRRAREQCASATSAPSRPRASGRERHRGRLEPIRRARGCAAPARGHAPTRAPRRRDRRRPARPTRTRPWSWARPPRSGARSSSGSGSGRLALPRLAAGRVHEDRAQPGVGVRLEGGAPAAASSVRASNQSTTVVMPASTAPSRPIRVAAYTSSACSGHRSSPRTPASSRRLAPRLRNSDRPRVTMGVDEPRHHDRCRWRRRPRRRGPGGPGRPRRSSRPSISTSAAAWFCVFTPSVRTQPPRRRSSRHAPLPPSTALRHGLVDAIDRRQRQILERGGRRQRDVRRGDADARPVEGPEPLLGDDRHELGPPSAQAGVLLDREQTVRSSRPTRGACACRAAPASGCRCTSAAMPSCASRSAASSARGTIGASATIVASVPSRSDLRRAELVDDLAVGHLGLRRPSSALCSKNTTGSGSRIAAAIRPTMSSGVEGATTLSPGIIIAQFSTLWECCAPKRTPPPFAVRITSGKLTWPFVMYRLFAISFATMSQHTARKSREHDLGDHRHPGHGRAHGRAEHAPARRSACPARDRARTPRPARPWS